ncbi:MAG TPA: nitroreductase family protein [Deltaproteobacteria bacterium]|nr:MAG: NADH dehydrogenase [Deltaproteobacteria bacterium GWC2_65_14]HBO69998.1 nitroreductase family protein [Deltaproteobacteria bacterium]
MEAMEAILSRRSIRRYTGDPVPEPVIEEILAAAMSAPSSKNQQTWHFVVITDRAILREVPSFHPYAKMVPDAPVAILVCADLQRDEHGFWVQDCSAATQNILLAAHAKGLGAVWLGVHPLEERVLGFRRLLGLPEHIVPLSLVPIGFPAVKKPREDRFDRTRIRKNRWQEGGP